MKNPLKISLPMSDENRDELTNDEAATKHRSSAENSLAHWPGFIGNSVPRFEDHRFITGKGRYVDDIAAGAANALVVAFVRSPHAHAKVRSIETASAASMEGVVAVFTGEDVADIGPLPVNPIIEGLHVPPFPILARDRVLAVGQPIAAIVATSGDQAEAAAEAIDIDFEPLRPATKPEKAAEGSPPLFDEISENEALHGGWHSGAVAKAFARAARIVDVKIHHSRLAPTPLEPRAALAEWNGETDGLTLWISTQSPHRARAAVAHMLGIDKRSVSVITPDVGGAFGMKASLYPEEVLLGFAARALGRTVRWTATRSEEFLSATHGRGFISEGELAVDAQGRFLALRARFACPLGHWLPFSAAVPAWNASRIVPGPYDVPNVDVSTRAYVTTTAPMGIYRGAGRPEASVLMERLVEAAARALDLDPAEVRRRNLVPAAAMPYERPTGTKLDSGDYPAVLDQALELGGYEALRSERERRRRAGELVGVGLGFYVEPSGQGWECASASLERDGTITIATGSTAQGQGRDTATRQIAAETLHQPLSAIRVKIGDTSDLHDGIGALASRSTAIGGSAVLQAARELRSRAREAAARLFQTDVRHVELDGDGFHVVGRDEAMVGWAALAHHIAEADRMGPNEPAIRVEATYEAPGEAWGSGCYMAQVAVDADTGVVTIERIVCVDDAGRQINPNLVEGQIVGGVAQGIGEALMERVAYDEHGQLISGSLMDYSLPRATDIPPIAVGRIETPSPFNALGAKGVGEAGCIGAPPAILNAVLDALAPMGVTHLDLPLTGERVWNAIRSAQGHRDH